MVHPANMESIELKKKSDLHLGRKLYHAIGVCTMIAIYHFAGHEWSWYILGALTAIAIPFDFLRLSHPKMNTFALKVFGPLMRQHEATHLSGMSYLFLGALFLLLYNDPHILTLTLLFLAFGDPIASFFGIRYGKDKIIGNKTVQGTMASLVVCGLIAIIYYYFHNIMTERLFIVAPLSGVIGAASELVPVGKLDDNLTFPLICSVLIWALFHLFGGFGV